MNCINMAIEMLGGDMGVGVLHTDLSRRLVKREHLCNKLGGSLRSSQLIACIVADWMDENPDERAIFYHVKEKADE